MGTPTYRSINLTATLLGIDRGKCGAATLAETSVAVPFVSAFAGALAITQAIRIASASAHHLIDTGDLRTLRGTLGRQPDRLIVGNVRAAGAPGQ